MEGKGILFKAFADIDVFDLEVGSRIPTTSSASAAARAHGGRHQPGRHPLPDCFYIEQKLRETLGIPVFHDDQHGTRSSRARRCSTRSP